jgi:hypothetical protein
MTRIVVTSGRGYVQLDVPVECAAGLEGYHTILPRVDDIQLPR